ncbi:hypothetical protein BJ085DRAFT_40473 [Dimargaris cristalligena]|uniref:Secreted protein n=1 Tax=Dimargaris cristalligena TaxID=215637 RepID=A0A4P9ZYI9_9FUNG|nr:hypothetical protein BJ085DRAFT_40473 [Dimargaris cristalligena]|eukprot:RKP38784.1 hypothetical protein BJ085DRAFT_40473 [Dimargaris cristalligena]
MHFPAFVLATFAIVALAWARDGHTDTANPSTSQDEVTASSTGLHASHRHPQQLVRRGKFPKKTREPCPYYPLVTITRIYESPTSLFVDKPGLVFQ